MAKALSLRDFLALLATLTSTEDKVRFYNTYITPPGAQAAPVVAAVRAAERVDAMHKNVVGVFAAIKAEHLTQSPVTQQAAINKLDTVAFERGQVGELACMYARHKDWAARSGHAPMGWAEFQASRLENPLSARAVDPDSGTYGVAVDITDTLRERGAR